jgi:NADPH:quinone reductase-like Zn-dependent oxidoreductase
MRAVSFDQYGGVEELQIIEKPQPVAAAGQVIVRIKAAGLNPGEVSIREGYLESMFPTTFPSGEGTDFAGLVTAVGEGVTKFVVNDAVVGYSHDRASHAEYVSVAADNLVSKPESVSWEIAGSLFVAGTTAYAAIQAVGVKDGDTVVISGVSGGVGVIAAQLAIAQGAKVIGIASQTYHNWLSELGISLLDYNKDVAAELAKLAVPIDAFIDTVGNGYVKMAIDLGVNKDRIDTIIDFAAAATYGVKAEGSAAASSATVLQELVTRIAEGTLAIPIAKTFPLDDVQAAYTYMGAKHELGKVVLTMD